MKLRLKYSIQFIIAVILLFLAGLLLKTDFLPFMNWWIALLVLGFIFLPLSQKIFFHFHDNGYLFSKVIGIAISGYLMWLFSSIRFMKFTRISCVIVVLFCFLVNIIIFMKSKKEEKLSLFNRDKVEGIITEELLFLALFLLWTYIRAFKPEAYGTEKFMDYGFMTSMMRAEYMPPQDLWFAGKSINYYYVGQFIATFMTKLSFVSVNAGYNLMLMTLAALAFVLPYSLVSNVTKTYLNEHNLTGKKAPIVAGMLSGAGVSIAGNMHFPLYYWIMPIINKLSGKQGTGFWFPDSTRFIGYNPDTTDKTIHEFPSYSFILGDLHAHVINVMFVITLLAVLFAWLLQRQNRMKSASSYKLMEDSNLFKEIYNPNIIMIGFFIGLFHTTNFWDFPIYYVVAGAIILFSNTVVYRFRIQTVWMTAIHGLVILAIAKLIALPFTLSFDQISTEICIAVAHTPFYQLMILWGLPIILIIGLFIELIQNNRLIQKEERDANSDNSESKKQKSYNSIQKFLIALPISDLFILTVGLCAIGLILIPEVIYVKDIYSGDYKRANTMFKLTYQAFIMFGISAGYIIVKFLRNKRFRWQRIFSLVTLILFLSSFWYTKVAVASWYGNIFNTNNYKGLDAAAFLKTQMPDDYLAIQWLNNNIQGTPVVLESNGDSYSDYERVSVFTGLPTVIGWYVHEWLWRDSNEVVDKRAADIQTIYTSSDRDQVTKLLDQYKVEYIYVGKLEYDKYKNVNSNLIKNLGDVVFTSPATSDKDYETYIVHVEPKG